MPIAQPRRHPAPRLRRHSNTSNPHTPVPHRSAARMSSTPWLQLGSRTLHLEELPALLERSRLLLPLFRRLLLEACIAGVAVSQEEQMAFQQRFLAQNGIDSAEKLQDWLQKANLTEEQASRNILEALQLETYKNQRFGSEVEKIFLDTKEQRDRVVYSLLRVKDQAAAQELHLRLEEGDATFTDLSQEHSAGPERETGGLIGPIAMGRLHPQLAELLRISKPGQLWHPMPIDDWWVIVRLDKKLPAQLDEAMETQIRDECFEQWLKQQLSTLEQAYSKATQERAGPAAPPGDPPAATEAPPPPPPEPRSDQPPSSDPPPEAREQPAEPSPRRLWPFGS
jgi:parvulin-like peptidyl-prolyl isomerase